MKKGCQLASLLQCRTWTALACLAIAYSPPGRATAAQNADVTAMVDRALGWLEKQEDSRLGGQCLIGLSFFKAGRPATHSKIVEAQKACESSINSISQEAVDNYSLGLALVFLLETDPVKNRSLAGRYVAEILKRQQSWGAWGYQGSDKGDTSQTQYPTLGLWLAKNHGIEVPTSAIEKTCGWLMRTQDPSGGWGYQGQDPGNVQRVNQTEIRPALAAAGLGSLYICADLLGVYEIEQTAREEGLPPALKPVGKDEAPKRRNPAAGTLDPKLIRRAMSDGNKWFDRNFTLESEGYTHYYLYALERYESFRELGEGRTDPNPRWYNEVVSLLRRTQQPEGGWQGADNPVVATSFSILVLVRSARQTINRVVTDLGKGVLLGGMGLPPNAADLRERDGKLIETPLAGTLDELLALIENPKNADLDRLADARLTVTLDSDVTKRSGQMARLRAIVSAGPFESRLVAVRALARVRELDNVPLLVFAMTDPDLRIVREADKGLKFISRKFEGVGLPAEPKVEEVRAAIAGWKAWYKSIRPHGEFLD
jgi:hypothetical protein